MARRGRSVGARSLRAVVAAVAIVLFYTLPANRAFLLHVIDVAGDIPADWRASREDPGIDALMTRHHGLNFTAPALIRDRLGSEHLLLFPPDEYLERFFARPQLLWVEPKYRYYVSGPIPTVGPGEADAARATHALIVTTASGRPDVEILPLDDARQLDLVRAFYRTGRSLR